MALNQTQRQMAVDPPNLPVAPTGVGSAGVGGSIDPLDPLDPAPQKKGAPLTADPKTSPGTSAQRRGGGGAVGGRRRLSPLCDLLSAAGALAGVVSTFAEPSGWCAGAALNVAWCAVCASAAPSSWCIEVVLVVAGVVWLFLLSTRLCPQAVHNLPRCVSVCVRPRCPVLPRVVPTVHRAVSKEGGGGGWREEAAEPPAPQWGRGSRGWRVRAHVLRVGSNLFLILTLDRKG